jgi:hypothetical protein
VADENRLLRERLATAECELNIFILSSELTHLGS